MGHADVNTTMRYLDDKSRADDARLLSHAFRANGDAADGGPRSAAWARPRCGSGRSRSRPAPGEGPCAGGWSARGRWPPLLLRGLEVGVGAGLMVGHIHHARDLRHGLDDGRLDPLAERDRGHRAALTAATQPEVG